MDNLKSEYNEAGLLNNQLGCYIENFPLMRANQFETVIKTDQMMWLEVR